MQSTYDSIARFLADREPPISVTRTDSLSSALSTMVENDFSQLPVIDKNGVLVGMISEQSITRHLLHFSDGDSMLDLTVDVLMDEVVTLSRADVDLFTILERLQNCYALVITEEHKPVGIITYYDTTTFLREWSEGLIRIQNIEQTLRQYIENVFETDKAIEAALHRALGSDRKDPTKPKRGYDELYFKDHVQLITHDEYWDRFKGYWGSQTLFTRVTTPVNQARNQLAHFRGNLNRVQLDAIKRAERWISNRPRKIHGEANIKLEDMTSIATATTGILTAPPWKYATLEQELAQKAGELNEGNIIYYQFGDIESLIAAELPTSARENRSWWGNDLPGLQHHSVAWLRGGWEVADVDFPNETVSFRRTNKPLISVFWADLVERLHNVRPSLKRQSRHYNSFYFLYDSGKKGFYYGWMFAPPDRKELWTQLSIDTRHSKSGLAKEYFNELKEQQQAIEDEIGESLTWDDQSLEHAVRIYAARPIRIYAPAEELEEVKSWAIGAIQRLADTMQPRIAELD